MKKFAEAVAAFDPLHGRLNAQQQQAFISSFLTPEQKQKLVVAKDYTAKIQTELRSWWGSTPTPSPAKK